MIRNELTPIECARRWWSELPYWRKKKVMDSYPQFVDWDPNGYHQPTQESWDNIKYTHYSKLKRPPTYRIVKNK